MIEYRCLVCDHIWLSAYAGESCSKCGQYDDVYAEDSGLNMSYTQAIDYMRFERDIVYKLRIGVLTLDESVMLIEKWFSSRGLK